MCVCLDQRQNEAERRSHTERCSVSAQTLFHFGSQKHGWIPGPSRTFPGPCQRVRTDLNNMTELELTLRHTYVTFTKHTSETNRWLSGRRSMNGDRGLNLLWVSLLSWEEPLSVCQDLNGSIKTLWQKILQFSSHEGTWKCELQSSCQATCEIISKQKPLKRGCGGESLTN